MRTSWLRNGGLHAGVLLALLVAAGWWTAPLTLLAQTTPASGVGITVDGVYQGRATTINCDSATMSCVMDGSILNIGSIGGTGSGASTAEPFITKIPSATLTNEFALSTLPAALLVNNPPSGVPTAYPGASCPGEFIRALSAIGAATCAGVSLATDVSGDLPYSSLAQGAALSVLGVAGAVPADVASIVAGTDGGVLRRSGVVLDFGPVDLASSAAVTNRLGYGNLPSATAGSRLLGRGSTGAGDWQEIGLGSGLTMAGTTLSATATGAGDFSTNTSISVVDELVLFADASGKMGKRSTETGVAKLASGVLSTSPVNLTSEVTGDLPYSNLTPASAASRLLGRGSVAAGDWQEILLGANLTMTGNTLSASGSVGAPLTATYWTSSPDATLTNEVNLGALTTALLLNTVSAGVATPSAYPGDACNDQFVRALSASGAFTCAPVGTTDITDASITFGKIQDIASARILGRVTAGPGDIEELTGTQATTLLDVFTATLKGVVPASGGGVLNFLRADGNWAAPVGGGNVTALTLTPDVIPRASGATSLVNSLLSDASALLSYSGSGGTTALKGAFTNATNQIVLGTTNTTTITMASLTGARIFTLPNADSNPVQPFTCAGGTFTKGISAAGVLDCQTPGGGVGDFSTNTLSSIVDELVLFADTGGKLGKRSTGTGVAKLTSGVLSVSAVNLASEVTGDLPYANLTPSSAASRLLGRGSASSGDWQEITLGANLTMTGTTLSATGGGGAPLTATYWTSTADITLLNEVNLGALTTGLILSTVSAGTATPSAYAGTTPCTNQFIRALDASGVATCATVALGTDVSGSLPAGALPAFSGGDVTSPAGSVVLTIGADTVTYAKMQNVSAASRLIGRGDSGPGDPQEIILGANLTMTGTTLSAAAGTGASTTATYITQTSEIGLLNEFALNSLANGLLLNVAATGQPTIYTGASCPNQFVRSLNASGAATCAPVALGTDVSGDLPFASLAQGAALSVLGVAGNATADVASIVATNDAEVLRRSGTTVGFGTVATAGLANDAVTFAKLQNIASARFVGRITAASGDPEELTGTQATTLIDVFTSALKGLAPASGGGTVNFLRADGTWQPPPSGGGNVTAAAPLDLNQLVIGQGTTAVAKLGTLGSTTTVLHGGAGAPTFAQVNLTTTVTGRLPYANLTASVFPNRLLGRNSATSGDWQEVTIGSGLSMSAGAVLTATGAVSGTGTANQVAYWTGPGVLAGSAGLQWDNALSRLSVNAPDIPVYLRTFDSGTTNVTNSLVLIHDTTATTGEGFGSQIVFQHRVNDVYVTNPVRLRAYRTLTDTTGGFAINVEQPTIGGVDRFVIDGLGTTTIIGPTDGGTALAVKNSSPATTGAMGVVNLFATSTGQMTEGFGPAIGFHARDADAVDNLMGYISFPRIGGAGPDTTGTFQVYTVTGGVAGKRLGYDVTGNAIVAEGGFLAKQGVASGLPTSVNGLFRLYNSATANETIIVATTPTAAVRTMTIPNADSNPVQPLACAGGTFAKGISSAGVIDCQTPAGTGGGDFSSNTTTSVDGEVLVFSGTTGKIGKRATTLIWDGTSFNVVGSTINTANLVRLENSHISQVADRTALALVRSTNAGTMSASFGVRQDFILTDTAASNLNARITVGMGSIGSTGTFEVATAIAGIMARRLFVDGTGQTSVSSLAGGGTECVQASSTGLLSKTGSACGAGGGVSTSGTPLNTQVALFTSGTAITGHSGLVYSTATGGLTNIMTGADTSTFRVDTAITNAVAPTLNLIANTPGDMADAFGPRLSFYMQDPGASSLGVYLDAWRIGGDTTASFGIGTRSAGSWAHRLVIDGAGKTIIQSGPATGFSTGLGSLTVLQQVGEIITAETSGTATGGPVMPSAFVAKHTTSGVMADGFGTRYTFVLRDDSNVDNYVASIYAQRSGTDDTGVLGFQTSILGTLANRLTIDAAGNVIAETNFQARGAIVSGTQASQTGSFRLYNSTNSSASDIVATTPTGTRVMTIPDANSNPVRPLPCPAGDFVSGIAATGVITCTTPPGGSGGPTIVRLAADVVMPSVSATYSDVTGLTFTPAANKDYLIEFAILYTGNTATVGVDFAVNGPASPTSLSCMARFPTLVTAVSDSVQVAYDSGVATTGQALTTVWPGTITCLFRNGANSSAFTLRHKLETGTAGVNTVKAGSVMRYTLLN